MKIVHLPVVCVQDCHLVLTRFDNMIMTVANMSHIVDAIQISFAFFIKHVLLFCSNYLDWVSLEKKLARWTQMSFSQVDCFLLWNLLL